MLRKIRTTLAIIVLALVTLLFLDVSGALHAWLGWLAKIQFLPAVMALNVGVIVALVALTLIFGRIYCSVICPLGIFQDVISWIYSKRKKNRFSFSPEKKWIRYPVLGLFIIAFVAGVNSFVALLAPYSSYGRIVNNLFRPVYEWGNNILARIAEHYESYAFSETDIWMKSLPTFVIAMVTLVVMIILAWKGGRTYCNTICPVGTILSFLARFSWLKIRMDEDKCIKCGLCSKNCKASAIDFKNFSIDYSRCVVCGDCLSPCKKDAIHYTLPLKKMIKEKESTEPQKVKTENDNENENGRERESIDTSRRSFLVSAAMATTAAALAQGKGDVDGGLAVIEDKIAPERNTPITPPGSISASNMAKHCTACQLCVSACPNGVLRPSTNLLTLMQPTSSYERGYCRPECTKCSDVCPAGAIRPITVEDKSSTQIGHAVWIKQNCIPVTDGVNCGNCERHCPTGAIEMVPLHEDEPEGVYIPAVNEAYCIGCGACENLCPARPFSAIYVEGHEVHKTI